jgi:ubiquinone/menaquinone biosynthesis C-methylase UbiE
MLGGLMSSTEAGNLKAAITYNAAADHFDDGPLAFWDRYGRRTIERLALAVGASVLDVGCGSGASAIPAAATVGPQGRVLGVDLAERLLALARMKARYGFKMSSFVWVTWRHWAFQMPHSMLSCAFLQFSSYPT